MARGGAASDLERLPGVLAATIFVESGAPPLVYLATTPDADPDALRAATAALLDERGTPAPLDRIHIAVPVAFRGVQPRGAVPRFSFEGFEVHRSEGRVTCTVRLRSDIRPAEGRATESDTPSGRARAAARAALLAAEAFDPAYRLGLEGLLIMDLFGHQAVFVLIDAAAGRTQAHLPGAALLDRSIEEGAALAVVHALRAWTV